MRASASLVVEWASLAPPDFPALQIALQLLAFCVAPKLDHLLRHLPPHASRLLASNIDQLVLETFQSLFDLRLTARQKEQAQFPLSRGGLWLRRRGGGCER